MQGPYIYTSLNEFYNIIIIELDQISPNTRSYFMVFFNSKGAFFSQKYKYIFENRGLNSLNRTRGELLHLTGQCLNCFI